jgi:hypothetical protein
MSQGYQNRLTMVENALAEEKVNPGKGKTLTDVAARVLSALDHIKENVR